MKKLIPILLLALISTAVWAGPPMGHRSNTRVIVVPERHHHHHRGGHWERRHNAWVWVVPAIVGGIIVYEATRQPDVIVIQKEIEPNCSPWTEIENSDGTITRTRTCKK